MRKAVDWLLRKQRVETTDIALQELDRGGSPMPPQHIEKLRAAAMRRFNTALVVANTANWVKIHLTMVNCGWVCKKHNSLSYQCFLHSFV